MSAIDHLTDDGYLCLVDRLEAAEEEVLYLTERLERVTAQREEANIRILVLEQKANLAYLEARRCLKS